MREVLSHVKSRKGILNFYFGNEQNILGKEQNSKKIIISRPNDPHPIICLKLLFKRLIIAHEHLKLSKINFRSHNFISYFLIAN